MTQMEYSVKFDKLTKMFGDQTVLDSIDFNIHAGKITTILGFSGAGKSTLMKHILGLLRPSEGRAVVLGQDLSVMNEFDLRDFRQNFGMLFQYAALFDSMSTFENIAFPLREFTKMSEGEVKDRVRALLESVGLPLESASKLPSQLSGGMRKRVGLARALALKPRILLYDEPTTGLDPITTHMVNNLIVETHQTSQHEGFTSIIISHDISATLKISDYVAFLEKGKVVEHLPSQEFRESKNPLIRRFIDLC